MKKVVLLLLTMAMFTGCSVSRGYTEVYAYDGITYVTYNWDYDR